MTMGGVDMEEKARRVLAEFEAEGCPYAVAHIREHLDGNTTSSFELVLDLILDGLVRLDRTR